MRIDTDTYTHTHAHCYRIWVHTAQSLDCSNPSLTTPIPLVSIAALTSNIFTLSFQTSFSLFFNMHVRVCMCVCTCRLLLSSEEGISSRDSGVMSVVRGPMWVLGMQLKSSVRARTLDHGVISPAQFYQVCHSQSLLEYMFYVCVL